MPTLTIANGAIPYFAAQTAAGLLLLIPVVLIEALILKKILKKQLLEALGLCFVANLASTIVGIFFIFIEIGIHDLRGIIVIVLILLSFVAAFIVSVWVEYAFYKIIWTDLAKRKLLKAVTIVNIITYVPLLVLAFYLFALNATPPEKASRIICTSNLKILGISLFQYADNYEGFFPNKSGAEGIEQLHGGGYFDEYKDFQIYVCPSTGKRKSMNKLTEKDVDYIYRSGFSLHCEDIDPAKTPVAWDKAENHKDYGNVLFLDGHVQGFIGANWMEQAGIKKKTSSRRK
jgi:prepilin-type processing-associated H-X9-DG protein